MSALPAPRATHYMRVAYSDLTVDQKIIGKFPAEGFADQFTRIGRLARIQAAQQNAMTRYNKIASEKLEWPKSVSFTTTSGSWQTCSLLKYSRCFFCKQAPDPGFTPSQLATCSKHSEKCSNLLCALNPLERSIKVELHLYQLSKVLMRAKPDNYTSMTPSEYGEYTSHVKDVILPSTHSDVSQALSELYETPDGALITKFVDNFEIFYVLTFLIAKAKGLEV
ncbi:MAG: hypothetical protein S4CHLAM37_12620 [Chlamydiia bacterium]|nr:hypothetical protein [Chlamydiia bacterium]